MTGHQLEYSVIKGQDVSIDVTNLQQDYMTQCVREVSQCQGQDSRLVIRYHVFYMILHMKFCLQQGYSNMALKLGSSRRKKDHSAQWRPSPQHRG